MKLVVGEGSCGLAAGAGRVHAALKAAGADVGVTGCIGMCYLEPIVEIREEGKGKREEGGSAGDTLVARLVRVQEKDAARIAAAAA